MKNLKLLVGALVAMFGFIACEQHECNDYDHSADLVGTWTCLTENYAEALIINADGTASITAPNAGDIRMYTTIEGVDWWQAEYNVFDGKIQYRGNGGDQAAVPVTAGQVVTLNFNAGTGTIK